MTGRIGLGGIYDSVWLEPYNRVRKITRSVKMAPMRSYRMRIPWWDWPVRLRPWFVAFTCGVMLALAFLGFTNFSHSLPLNDKLLHFICFGLATGVFYFIIDVDDESRRIWYWRHCSLMFTGFVCLICGGVISEFVQAMLPYKTFQFGDIVANLLGASLGLEISRRLEYNYRQRREIKRLYQPLTAGLVDDDALYDEDDMSTSNRLPTHTDPYAGSGGYINANSNTYAQPAMENVWDDREEELFTIGDEDGGTPRRF